MLILWVTLGTLLKIPETKLKTKSLVTARGYKENQKIQKHFYSLHTHIKTPKISSIIITIIIALLLTTIAYLFTVLHPLLF